MFLEIINSRNQDRKKKYIKKIFYLFQKILRKMFKTKNFLVIILILLIISTLYRPVLSNSKLEKAACYLPQSCRIDSVYLLSFLFGREHISLDEAKGFVCNVKNQTFNFQGFNAMLAKIYQNEHCFINKNISSHFAVKFPRNLETRLDENFNLKGIFEFLGVLSLRNFFTLHMSNVRGFSIKLNMERIKQNFVAKQNASKINILRSNVDFYSNGSLVKNCEDLVSTYGRTWSPSTIFQINLKNTNTEILFFRCWFK